MAPARFTTEGIEGIKLVDIFGLAEQAITTNHEQP
jgi:hypothetical protein